MEGVGVDVSDAWYSGGAESGSGMDRGWSKKGGVWRKAAGNRGNLDDGMRTGLCCEYGGDGCGN